MATIYEVGEAEGVLYIAIEYISGPTLRSEMAKGPLSVPVALAYAVQITEALHAAHAVGVVHRDLKPSNVMLTEDGASELGIDRCESVMARCSRSDVVTIHVPHNNAKKPVTDEPGFFSPGKKKPKYRTGGKPSDLRRAQEVDLFVFHYFGCRINL